MAIFSAITARTNKSTGYSTGVCEGVEHARNDGFISGIILLMTMNTRHGRGGEESYHTKRLRR